MFSVFRDGVYFDVVCLFSVEHVRVQQPIAITFFYVVFHIGVEQMVSDKVVVDIFVTDFRQ